MYIFSGLVWRWWKDGIALDRWRASEVVLAVLATVMFSMASSALEQTA
jgi:drug/metabolite transporter superfamily protein YnfA